MFCTEHCKPEALWCPWAPPPRSSEHEMSKCPRSFCSCQWLEAPFCSLRRLPLSRDCVPLSSSHLASSRFRLKCFSLWGLSEHACLQKATYYIPNVCYCWIILWCSSILPSCWTFLPKEIVSAWRQHRVLYFPGPRTIWTYDQTGTKEMLSDSFMELEIWNCLFQNGCYEFVYSQDFWMKILWVVFLTFFSSVSMNYQSLYLKYLILVDTEFTAYFRKNNFRERKLACLFHFPILYIRICPWGITKAAWSKRKA